MLKWSVRRWNTLVAVRIFRSSGFVLGSTRGFNYLVKVSLNLNIFLCIYICELLR